MGKYLGVADDETLRRKYGLTEADLHRLDRDAQQYEQGVFPPGKTVPIGRPPLSDEELVTVAFKIPKSKRDSMDASARHRGVTRSEFLRELIDQELATG